MMITKNKSLLAAAGAVAIGLALWYYFSSKNEAAYQTAAIERGKVQASISATGNCNAVVTVQVGSQVSGNIKALYADFNTKVKKGQVVALIDPQPFQARVDQSKAAVDSARAAVVSAQAQVEKANADIASARANAANQNAAIVKAKAAATDAKTKLGSRRILFQDGILSKDDLDTAQSTYDQAAAEQQAAEAQLDAANHQIQSAQAMYRVAETQLSAAQAQVKQAQASLEQAQLDLDHTEITAPVDGTVIARHMDVGQTIAASFQAPTIFEIAQDLTKMQVDTNVDEADVGQVKLGQEARFSVDAYPVNIFHGTVQQIRQAPINVQNVITYDVVVAVSNPDLKLLPGMTANVKILTSEQDAVLKIPNAALRFRPPDAQTQTQVHAAGKKQDAGSTVWVLDSDGKPKAVKVTLGITDGMFTSVQSGDLKDGDQVITSSLMKTSSAAPAPRGPQGPRF
ncbi:MAG TPA: efflux RND transporter periplasmic adaptor subunit [Bryobacteraceae bacterium]|nr:efflux RND transporter periplasmic adaptor subunit [Bryobacteraceae bacterium]